MDIIVIVTERSYIRCSINIYVGRRVTLDRHTTTCLFPVGVSRVTAFFRLFKLVFGGTDSTRWTCESVQNRRSLWRWGASTVI